MDNFVFDKKLEKIIEANTNKWIDWIIDLQSIAQNGLTYGKDTFDLERYQLLRNISAEMMSEISNLPLQKIKNLFCNERGYQTPKLDTRTAIFKNEKILLVKENNDKWSLPGGWVDVQKSAAESAIQEVKEEAGLNINLSKVIAIQDRDKHNYPKQVSRIIKIFFLGELIDGEFKENIETRASNYFTLNELPELDAAKTTREQINMCYQASQTENWQTYFD